MTWEFRILEDLADFHLGKMLDQRKNKGEFQPYLANVNVRWGEFELGNLKEMRFEAAEFTRYNLEFGDIVMCEGGEPGRCAIWKNQLPRMMFQKALHRIRPRASMDHRFLYYSFLNRGKANGFDQYCTGSTIKHLPQQNLAKVEVEVPPLPTQRRIASILSAYDDLIENNTRRIAILEEMARRLYEEWFVHFRFPGHEEQDHAGGVPSGWGRQQLSELVTTQYGYTASASVDPVGPKLLRGMDINKQSYIDWAQVPYCLIETKKMEKYRLEEGDLLVIRMADPGKIGFVEESVDAVFASYLVRLKIVSPDITPLYLFFVLNGDGYQGYITGVSTGTTRKSASAGVITGYEVAVPPRALLERFQTLISPFRSQMKTLVRKNTNLRSQRDLLLPKLVSGEIDVSSSEEQAEAAVA